jgi:hypothetical protein
MFVRPVEIKLSSDPRIARNLQRRFDKSFNELQRLGFQSAWVAEELLFPFSLILLFAIYAIAKLMRDQVDCVSPLRLRMYSIYLQNGDRTVLASIGALANSFCSFFDDGAALLTIDQQQEVPRDKRGIPKIEGLEIVVISGRLPDLFQAHQAAIAERTARNVKVKKIDFETWRILSQQRVDQQSFAGSAYISFLLLAGVVWGVQALFF